MNAMEKVVEEQALDIKIKAIGSSELADEAEGVDVFLIAPQVRYMKGSVEKYGRPVAVIQGPVYALADGAQALKQVAQLLEAEGAQ